MKTIVFPTFLTLVVLVLGCTPEKPPMVDSKLESEATKNTKIKQGTVPVSDRTVFAIAWNLESDGSDPKVIAEEIKELPKSHIYAFCEVDPDEFKRFHKACGESFDAIESKSGKNDRLQIVYDTKQFELVRRLELDEINYRGRYRSPLVAHLRHLSSKQEFLLMTLHLARGKAKVRQEQAQKLVDWAREQGMPIVAIGDFNFDYDFEKKNGNEAFKIFQRDGIWSWVKPVQFIDTNWYDPDGDGKDNYEGSMLDFAFVANAAKKWVKQCVVIERKGDFPDDRKTSDHRPIRIQFDVPAGLR